MRLANWNMQGGNAKTENKWNEGVAPLLKQLDLDIFCLQECGAVPSSATYIQSIGDVAIYQWHGYHLLFYNWDQNGDRVNLAIVLKQSYQWKDVFTIPRKPDRRPLLCVEIDDEHYMSIHAKPGGADVESLLNAAYEQCGSSGWVVAGDFNREPDMIPGGEWVVCPPNKKTHPSTSPDKKIDFAVRAQQDQQVTGDVLTQILYSDHLPVAYDL